jgi:drug/metabolite transporter (DMT)-like permease
MTLTRRSLLLMVAFVALWAAVEAAAGHLHHAYSPYQVVWTRYAVHLTLMLAVWGLSEPISLVRTGRPVFQIARSLLMLGMPCSLIIALSHGVDQGTVLAIFWLSPLLIFAFAKILLGERASLALWLAAACASAGAILLVGPGSLPAPLLLIFPAGMAITFSLYVVMTRSLRSERTRANLFYTALGVFLALCPVMPRLWVTPTVHDLLVLVTIGVVGFAALWALDRTAADAPVSASAPLTALQAVFSAGTGAGFSNLHFNLGTVGALLIGGVALYLFWRSPDSSLQQVL